MGTVYYTYWMDGWENLRSKRSILIRFPLCINFKVKLNATGKFVIKNSTLHADGLKMLRVQMFRLLLWASSIFYRCTNLLIYDFIDFQSFLYILIHFYSCLLLFLPKINDIILPVHNMEVLDICHPNTIYINTVNLLIKSLCSAKSHDSHMIFSVKLYLNQHVVDFFFIQIKLAQKLKGNKWKTSSTSATYSCN